MALVDLKSNLANFRSDFVTPGVEKKNAPAASALNIDVIPKPYSGKTQFTKKFIDTSLFDRADQFILKYTGRTQFTSKYVNTSKFNIDSTPAKFSPSGIYLPELYTDKKINSSKFNIDSTPTKFSPNTKYVPTKYYPEKVLPKIPTRWSGTNPPAVNFIDDTTSNAKGFTVNLGKSGAYEKSQFISFDYKKSIPTRNSKFDQGTATLIRQLGNGSPFPDTLYYNDGRPASATAYSWLPKEHTGFHLGNTYSAAAGKIGFLAPTYNTNSPIDELYKKYNLQDAANSEASTGPNTSYIRQPFITRGLQRRGKESPQRWGIGNFDDGLIRGGITTAIERAAVDTARIAKWMASPRGLLWIVKQIGLGLTNPKVPAPAGRFSRATRIHAGVTSLLSVAGTAFGLHFTRHGLPFRNEIASYENVVNRSTSRLQELNDEYGNPGKTFIIKSWSDLLGLAVSKGKALITKSLGSATLSGLGGPNSVYGIGFTRIKRDVDTSQRGIYFDKSSYLHPYVGSLRAYTNNPYDAAEDSDRNTVSSIDDETNKYSLKGRYFRSINDKVDFAAGPVEPGTGPVVISKNVYKPSSILKNGDKDAEGNALVQSKKFKVNFGKAKTGHYLDNTKDKNSNLALVDYDNASKLKQKADNLTDTIENVDAGTGGNVIATSMQRQLSYPTAPINPIDTYITLAYTRIPNRKTDSVNSFNDFRDTIGDDAGTGNSKNQEEGLLGGRRNTGYYANNNLETKYGFGKLGEVGADRSKPNDFIVKSFSGKKADRTLLSGNSKFRGDRITAIDVVNEQVTRNEVYPKDGSAKASDLIKFYFEDGNQGTNVMPFRCTMTGFTDTFSPGWDPVDIMGRPDKAYLYSSFERSVNFNFIVAAMSRSEMIPMWRKLNKLASYTMPDFDGNGGRPAGPFMRISIGNLFQQTPGFITSLSYTIPDDATWDIADDINLANNPTPKQLPMMVEIGMSFTVVGDFRPQLNGRVYSLQPLGGKPRDTGDWLQDSKTTLVSPPATGNTSNTATTTPATTTSTTTNA